MKTRLCGCAGLITMMMTGLGCVSPGYNLPPAGQLAAPGPGVDGPGPGVLTSAELMVGAAGVMPAALVADCYGRGVGNGSTGPISTQVMFAKPSGMRVYWDVSGAGQFSDTPLISPGRTNFSQPGLYRIKLTNIPGHEGVELYPTLEIGPVTRRTKAFLSHNTIPVQLTVDDFNQILSGNFVTKVIYLPDPEFQELAVAGVETLVSTRLDPGIDPIAEADRRGVILGVLRVGNKDLEMPTGSMAEPPVSSVRTVGFKGAHVGAAGGLYSGGGGVPMPTSAGMFVGGPGGPGFGAGGHISGVNMPPYGMPITGTPLGLPGPPHIPLGGPAGLQKHVIRNHTRSYIPKPSRRVDIHVQQKPGISYPEPSTRAWIREYNHPNCGHGVGVTCSNCAPQ